MNVYVDLDTGTVLNGPVVQVPAEIIPEDASDAQILEAVADFQARGGYR